MDYVVLFVKFLQNTSNKFGGLVAIFVYMVYDTPHKLHD